MSIPTTSAPKRARGIAVVPSPQPRSKTLSGGVMPRDFTRASPDCRMRAAISVKSPFSHNALFGFTVDSAKVLKRVPTFLRLVKNGRKGTGRPVGEDEDAAWRAARCNQSETTRRNALLEQPLSFSEHHWKDPEAIFVDEIGGDQRLQQFAAAPNMQHRPLRCLQPAELVHDITAYALRGLPVEWVEAAGDDVFGRPVEGLRDRVVALVRPVGGEELVGPASQKHVEFTGDGLSYDLLRGFVHEGHGPASVGEPVPRILLGATGPLHDAVQRDLGDCDNLSHDFSPVLAVRGNFPPFGNLLKVYFSC